MIRLVVSFLTRANDNCGMVGDRDGSSGLRLNTGGRRKATHRETLAIGTEELSMFVAALVMMVLAQAPASSATLSGQVVDSSGRPAAGVEVLLSGRGRAIGGRPVLSRARSDHDGRFRIGVPAEKDPRRARFMLAGWAPPRRPGGRAGVSRRRWRQLPGAVQLLLWRPPAHDGSRGGT